MIGGREAGNSSVNRDLRTGTRRPSREAVGRRPAPSGGVDYLHRLPSAGATVGSGRPRTELRDGTVLFSVSGSPYRRGARMERFCRLFLSVLTSGSCRSVV
jgi:hypothetical protein